MGKTESSKVRRRLKPPSFDPFNPWVSQRRLGFLMRLINVPLECELCGNLSSKLRLHDAFCEGMFLVIEANLPTPDIRSGTPYREMYEPVTHAEGTDGRERHSTAMLPDSPRPKFEIKTARPNENEGHRQNGKNIVMCDENHLVHQNASHYYLNDTDGQFCSGSAHGTTISLERLATRVSAWLKYDGCKAAAFSRRVHASDNQ